MKNVHDILDIHQHLVDMFLHLAMVHTGKIKPEQLSELYDFSKIPQTWITDLPDDFRGHLWASDVLGESGVNNITNHPEMIKIREDAIKKYEEHKKAYEAYCKEMIEQGFVYEGGNGWGSWVKKH